MAFRGHFEHTLDAKNRLNIPAKFRAGLSGGLVLSKYLEPCVAIWTPEGFESWTQSFLGSLNPLSDERRKLTRFFAGGSFDADLDAGGRVTLNAPLLDHAGLKREVVVVGNLDHLEIWDRDAYHAEQRELSRDVLEIARSLGHPS
jgi:MraZ protein